MASTPLLFLGAASALIDTLPVLGLTLVFTAVAALSAAPAAWWRRAIGIGVMLGAGAMDALAGGALRAAGAAAVAAGAYCTDPQGPRRWPARLSAGLPVAALV
ncbi:MAG: hypothetical protein U1F49_02605 [Rubrivivax sp.]